MIKGALHIHSEISPDSRLSRRYLRDIFKGAGYNFVLITEHAEDLDAGRYDALKEEYHNLSDDKFLMIPGIEIKWKDRVHFLAYGAKNYMPNEKDMPITDTARVIKNNTQCPFLVWGHFGHPKPIPREYVDCMGLVDGIEIFNTAYHGLMAPSYEGLRLANDMRKDKRSIVVTAGLDLHSPGRHEAISCIIKNINFVERDEIFKHLVKGDFISKGIFYTLEQPGEGYNKLELFYSWCAGIARGLVDILRRLKKGIKWNP